MPIFFFLFFFFTISLKVFFLPSARSLRRMGQLFFFFSENVPYDPEALSESEMEQSIAEHVYHIPMKILSNFKWEAVTAVWFEWRNFGPNDNWRPRKNAKQTSEGDGISPVAEPHRHGKAQICTALPCSCFSCPRVSKRGEEKSASGAKIALT